MKPEDIDRIARQVGYPIQQPEWRKATEEFAALVIANNPPQSFMSWQEGYDAGRNAATLEFLKQLRQMHDSYSLQSNPNTVQAKRVQR